jgi:hypothetical protein
MYNDRGSPSLTGVTYSGNSAEYGGGMHNHRGSPTLMGVTFCDNAAEFYGGGIFNDGDLTLTGVTFSGNSAEDGGGTYNYIDASLTMVSCSVGPGNSGVVTGGGIANWGVMTVTNSTISDNSDAGAFGGAGIVNSGVLSMTNCTISGNSTNLAGGGIRQQDGSLGLTHCTITGNTADADADGLGGGGGIYGALKSVLVKNTIIADNGLGAGSAASGPDVDGVFTSQGYNLIGNAADSTGFGVAGDQVGSDEVPINPLLGRLSHNLPGDTATHALLPGSPALDWIPYGVNGCGTEITSDQRGNARPLPAGRACDIGAYEASPKVYLPLVVRDSP